MRPPFTSERLHARGSRATTAALSGLALIAVLAHESGRYIADSRFAFYWAPAKVLGSFGSLWQADLDLGGPRPGYSPVPFAFTAVLDGVGLPPWLIQRGVHLLLLVLAGTGAAAAYRRLVGSNGSETGPMVTGLVYMFSPFAAAFLIPSFLFLHTALAPWFLLAFIRGVTDRERWRWAAVFALLAFVSVGLNTPSFVLSLSPILLAGLWYLLAVERSTNWNAVVRWSLSTLLLLAVASLPLVLRTISGSEELALNLGRTETVQAVSQASSWPESLRGLGFWISYYSFGQPIAGSTADFLGSPVVLIATFVAPVVALLTLWASPTRARLMAGAMVFLAGAIMVGAFPFNSPAPFGLLLINLYDWVPWSFALRNTYKAGAGLVLGTALLVGMAVGAWRQMWPNRIWRPAGAVLLAVVVVGAGWPFWQGAIYANRPHLDTVPGYWHDAFDWLEEQPGTTRVLTIPGGQPEAYRWGTALDGILDALLNRPHLQARRLSPSPPDAANLVAAVDRAVSTEDYIPGTLAPLARRLGVEYLVIRNDLRWESLDVPRPAELQPLREDPDLRYVAAFGGQGENTTTSDDRSPEATAERALSPVEIYRVPDVDATVRATSSTSSTLVSGNGAAWADLARAGLLDGSSPVRYSARETPEALRRHFADGATLIVTDTNRRRRASLQPLAYTLALDDPTVRVEDQFRQSGSQSVADFGDALFISETDTGNLASVGLEHRPAAAFDDDPTTSWLAGASSRALGQTLDIAFRDPQRIDQVRLVPAMLGPISRRPDRVSIEFDSGAPVTSAVPRDGLDLEFEARTTESLRIRVIATTGTGTGPFGWSTVHLPGLDLRESIRVPDDAFRAAEDLPDLQLALSESPVEYHLRQWQERGSAVEQSLHRSLRTVGQRFYDIDGTLSAGPAGADAMLAELLGADTVAVASLDGTGEAGPPAMAVVDGRDDTGWSPPEGRNGLIRISFPSRPVGGVELVAEVSETASKPMVLAIRSGGGRTRTPVDDEDCGPVDPATARRVCTVAVPLDGAQISRLQVSTAGTILDASPTSGPAARVLEVRIDGEPNPAIPSSPPGDCSDVGLTIDDQPVPVRFESGLADLVAGDVVAFRACNRVLLDDGDHRVAAGSHLFMDQVHLSTTGGRANSAVSEPEPPPSVEVLSQTPTSIRVRLEGEGRALLFSGQAFDAAWRATGEGITDGRPENVDVQSGWTVELDGETEVVISLPAQRQYAFAVLLSVLGLLLCGLLVQLNPRTSAPGMGQPERVGQGRVWADGVIVLLAFAVGALPGATLALVGVIAVRRSPRIGRYFALAAAALVALAALYSLPPLGPDLTPINSGWALRRDAANDFGRLAAVALLVALVKPRPVDLGPTPIDPPDADEIATSPDPADLPRDG